MKKILFLTDFSEASVRSLRYLGELYESEDCEFTILHCYELPPGVPYHLIPQSTCKKMQGKMVQYLLKVRREGTLGRHRYEGRVLPGPAPALVGMLCALEGYEVVQQGTWAAAPTRQAESNVRSGREYSRKTTGG
jgi:hypothetical protein